MKNEDEENTKKKPYKYYQTLLNFTYQEAVKWEKPWVVGLSAQSKYAMVRLILSLVMRLSQMIQWICATIYLFIEKKEATTCKRKPNVYVDTACWEILDWLGGLIAELKNTIWHRWIIVTREYASGRNARILCLNTNISLLPYSTFPLTQLYNS